MGQLNVVSQIKKYGAVKAVPNGDGSYSLVLANGEILQSVSPVFAWPGITIPGVMELPAANTFENGAVVLLHKDNFVGAGANPCGIEIQADALNNIWRPHGRQVIWSAFFGLRASPTVFLTATGRFDIGTDPVIPAGLLNYAGARMRFSEQFFFTNATATTGPTIATYLGANLATYSSNPTLMDNTATANNNGTFQPETLIHRASSSSLLTNRHGIRGGNGSSGWIADVLGGNLNFAASQMVSYGVTNLGTATRIDMHGLEIAWEA